MNRKIEWDTYVFDEIELVYEKAEEDRSIAGQLEKLETLALSEARNNCGMFKMSGGPQLTPETYDGLGENVKEQMIKALSDIGLDSLDTDMASAKIIVRFTPKIQKVLGCTMFNLLNRIEKLDGAINIINPKWMLELQVPLGGKKGFIGMEMLIMQLYPWLSIREISTNEVAE